MNEHHPEVATAEGTAQWLFELHPAWANPDERQKLALFLVGKTALEIYRTGFLIGATLMLEAVSRQAVTEIGHG
jgi:hypothetical protein